MIKVMIAEDNTALSNKYCEFLTKDKDIEIVYNTVDGKETLKKYNELHPDVLILDLDLPTINGLDIINNLCLDDNERKKCNIIIVSGNHQLRYNVFNTKKVYRIMPKPIHFEDLLATVKEIKEEQDNILFTDDDIRDFLQTLNFNVYSDGTDYLIEAINIAYERPNLLKNIKDIYYIISTRHSLSESSVKWSIRNAVDVMNKNTSNDEINKKLKVTGYRKMTPKYFIPLVISHFKAS